MHRIRALPGTWGILLVWIISYIADRIFGLMPLLSGQGFGIINGEYWRLFTAWMLHGNVLHLLVNCLGLYWIGVFLEKPLGTRRYLSCAALGLILSQLLLCAILPKTDTMFGGSMLTFQLLGLIAGGQRKSAFPRFRWHTDYAGYLLPYAILGNLPIFSFMNGTTLVIHAASLAAGFAVSVLL